MLANALYPYDNGKYIPVVCEGQPHDYNNELCGFNDRDVAKTAIYAFTYGGGLIKLGKIAKDSKPIQDDAKKKTIPSGYMRYLKESGLDSEEYIRFAKMGMVVKERFFDNLDGFSDLLDALEKEWSDNNEQFIRGVDRRRIPCDRRNVLLNRRLQSDGAVVMKEALRQHYILAYSKFGPHGERWAYCANIHDEFQVECEATLATQFKELGNLAIATTGKVLGLACPLEGDSNIGDNWYATH